MASTQATSSRWSWAALVAAFVAWLSAFPTWGLSAVLAPLTLLLSAIAWRRERHDAVLWIGLALNALLAVILLAELVALLTGEAALGWE
jgi:predicted branched-subunit amino acid permease